ncbi:MAG: response regulator transcription factor [Candidatus Aminicenantales bacterium]
MRKFLLVEDHGVVKECLRYTLVDSFPECACDEAADAQEAMNKIWKNAYDLVLLDISLPGRSGLDVLKQIKKVKPELAVLILTMYEEKMFGLRALRAGAAGYMTKKNTVSELKTAIEQILQGRKYISPSLAELLISEFDEAGERPPHAELTDDELQVLTMIASGRKTKEIAEDLALSVKTINATRGRVLKKMKMNRSSRNSNSLYMNKLQGMGFHFS